MKPPAKDEEAEYKMAVACGMHFGLAAGINVASETI
jgi:hypothetical protein